MQKNQMATAKLTNTEKSNLEKCLMVYSWHFEKLFIDNCVLVSKNIIGWEKENHDSKYSPKPITICIYGLNGMNSETKQSTISNFFIHYDCRVYQEWNIERALKLQELLKKEFLIKKLRKKSRVAKMKSKTSPIKKVA